MSAHAGSTCPSFILTAARMLRTEASRQGRMAADFSKAARAAWWCPALNSARPSQSQLNLSRGAMAHALDSREAASEKRFRRYSARPRSLNRLALGSYTLQSLIRHEQDEKKQPCTGAYLATPYEGQADFIYVERAAAGKQAHLHDGMYVRVLSHHLMVHRTF